MTLSTPTAERISLRLALQDAPPELIGYEITFRVPLVCQRKWNRRRGSYTESNTRNAKVTSVARIRGGGSYVEVPLEWVGVKHVGHDENIYVTYPYVKYVPEVLRGCTLHIQVIHRLRAVHDKKLI